MESNIITAEIAEQGYNSPGCSLKSGCIHDSNEFGAFDNVTGVCWVCGKTASNIRQYMTAPTACEKDVNNEPFPSILESAEQERRERRAAQ
jgi:hypothetical protein